MEPESQVIGAPGADTYDATGCNFPPYRVRMALSASAAAGAAEHHDSSTLTALRPTSSTSVTNGYSVRTE